MAAGERASKTRNQSTETDWYAGFSDLSIFDDSRGVRGELKYSSQSSAVKRFVLEPTTDGSVFESNPENLSEKRRIVAPKFASLLRENLTEKLEFKENNIDALNEKLRVLLCDNRTLHDNVRHLKKTSQELQDNESELQEVVSGIKTAFEDLQKENKEIREDVEDLEAIIRELRQDKTKLLRTVSEQQTTTDSLRNKVLSLKNGKEEEEIKLSKLRAEMSAMKKTLSAIYQDIDEANREKDNLRKRLNCMEVHLNMYAINQGIMAMKTRVDPSPNTKYDEL